MSKKSDIQDEIDRKTKEFLESGNTVNAFTIPESLRFSPSGINTYKHREYLKKLQFRWDPDSEPDTSPLYVFKYVGPTAPGAWIAPSKEVWEMAYHHLKTLNNFGGAVRYTGINTSEALTKRFVTRHSNESPNRKEDIKINQYPTGEQGE